MKKSQNIWSMMVLWRKRNLELSCMRKNSWQQHPHNIDNSGKSNMQLIEIPNRQQQNAYYVE